MNKFFTLIAVTLLAVSANAKQVIDFSAKFPYGETIVFGNWEWKGLVLAEGEPVVSGSTADDSNVQYFDASAYDYLCIKYSEANNGFQVILQYKCLGTVGQWGTEFDQASTDIQANTSGLVAIKLDAAKKNTINQIAIQSKGEGSIVIEEIYWASETEYTADAAANPVVPYIAPTKDLNVANATGGWGGKTFDPETHTATITEDNAASGWWSDGDFSSYDYFVIEVENLTKVGYAQFGIYNTNFAIGEGSFVKVCDISVLNRTGGTNVVIQGGAGTTWTWKRAYYATAAYVQENNIHDETIYGDTYEFSLDNLSAGFRSSYDAATHTITIDGDDENEDGGAGWGWWGTPADFSHFDNIVIELAPTTVGGQVVVQYADAAGARNRAAAEAGVVEFGTGATCIVVPLDNAGKSAVQQIYIQGMNKGDQFKLTGAYAAVASATPEANLGDVTGITNIHAGTNNAAPMYNLAGQRVDSSYKGVVIQNGKKFMNQ